MYALLFATSFPSRQFTALKNRSKHFMPFSVRREGSSWSTLLSKKSLLMSGSKSGSSPISLEYHLKQASRSHRYTAFSARHFQICFACGAHSHSWPSFSKNLGKTGKNKPSELHRVYPKMQSIDIYTYRQSIHKVIENQTPLSKLSLLLRLALA